jgi:hypothetical protein
MAQLTADTIRVFEKGDIQPGPNDIPAKAAVATYKGSAVGSSAGFGRQLVAGDSFLGFAEEACDNTIGTAANGSKNIRVRQRGTVTLNVTGVASAADIASTVYASDGNTFTNASTGNSSVGKVVRWIAGTQCQVFFEALQIRSL